MTVKIVTDSTCDLPDEALAASGVTMVPVDVVYRGHAYKDRVELSHDELFRLLERGEDVPTTAAPPPARFAEAYERLARETGQIVSLHLTSEHSAVCDSARQGRDMVKARCRIEVVDSRWLSMGLGLLALDAAEAANSGATLEEVAALVKREAASTRAYAVLDTFRYLVLGGRLNKVIGTLGTTLRLRLLLTLRDGRLRPCGVARTYPLAIERMLSLTEGLGPLAEWCVVYSTDKGPADALAERLSRLCPPGRVPIARLGPALGVHGGPGTVAVIAKVKEG